MAELYAVRTSMLSTIVLLPSADRMPSAHAAPCRRRLRSTLPAVRRAQLWRRSATVAAASVTLHVLDPGPGCLGLGVVMPVDQQLRAVGEVRGELEEERVEALIHAVHVELVHHRCRLHDSRAGPAVGCAALLGPEHGVLLLRHPANCARLASTRPAAALTGTCPLSPADASVRVGRPGRRMLLAGSWLRCRRQCRRRRSGAPVGLRVLPPAQ